jgi:hypothetical protein
MHHVDQAGRLSVSLLLVTLVTLLGVTAAVPNDQPNDPFGEKTVAEFPDPLAKSRNAVREQIGSHDLIVSSCTKRIADDCAAAKKFINLMIKPSAGRWRSALDIFKSGSGDCKNYSISKYAALLKAGVPLDQLRLIIVHNNARRENRMVVGVFEDGQWLLLDNLTMTLVRDTARKVYVPMFVLDETGARRYLPANRSG